MEADQANEYPDVLNRFLRYVQVYTTSEDDKEEIPSTQRQFDLAKLLVEELQAMGIEDANVDEHCIVQATILATSAQEIPTICFVAHVDTSPEEPGEHVQPRILTYDVGTITYPNNPDLVITPEEMPILTSLAGEQLVTSDGTTLLGADDKAGVAEIMAAAAYLMQHPDLPRGTIRLIFTPDEEVGHGVDAVDVPALQAECGYTMDGDELGVIEAECFNAASGSITVKGYNVHPGYAYGKMVNATRIIRDILTLFPDDAAPETTQELEGYSHPLRVQGSVNEATVDLLLRDFDHDALLAKIQHIKDGIASIQETWPKATITANITERYRNMKEIMDQHPQVTEIAEEAVRRLGVEPRRKAIRGGTDGARLSFMGLPCPNLFAGGLNFHSKKEFVPVRWMEQAVQTILNIVDLWAGSSNDT